MVVRESVIFGIPLDPADPSNNAMAPVSGITQGRDIDFDDQEQYVYWVQSTVSDTSDVNMICCIVVFGQISTSNGFWLRIHLKYV